MEKRTWDEKGGENCLPEVLHPPMPGRGHASSCTKVSKDDLVYKTKVVLLLVAQAARIKRSDSGKPLIYWDMCSIESPFYYYFVSIDYKRLLNTYKALTFRSYSVIPEWAYYLLWSFTPVPVKRCRLFVSAWNNEHYSRGRAPQDPTSTKGLGLRHGLQLYGKSIWFS